MCHAWLPKVATNSEQGREPVCVPGGHATLTLRELLWIGAILLQFFTCVKGPRHATPTALLLGLSNPVPIPKRFSGVTPRHSNPSNSKIFPRHAIPIPTWNGIAVQFQFQSARPKQRHSTPRRKAPILQFLWNGVGLALDYNSYSVGCGSLGLFSKHKMITKNKKNSKLYTAVLRLLCQDVCMSIFYTNA